VFVTHKDSVPVRRPAGLSTRILLQLGDTADTRFSVTWVEVEPGSSQRPHRHDAQQVYVIVHGEGEMQVEDETADVREGSLALVPPGARHALKNTGAQPLTYVSAANPAVSMTDLYDRGDLRDGDPPAS